MAEIQFENSKYEIRYISLDEGIKAITSVELNKQLFSEDGNYKCDEARFIDEQIYFFVDPSKMRLKDSSLCNYVKKHCY